MTYISTLAVVAPVVNAFLAHSVTVHRRTRVVVLGYVRQLDVVEGGGGGYELS